MSVTDKETVQVTAPTGFALERFLLSVFLALEARAVGRGAAPQFSATAILPTFSAGAALLYGGAFGAILDYRTPLAGRPGDAGLRRERKCSMLRAGRAQEVMGEARQAWAPPG